MFEDINEMILEFKEARKNGFIDAKEIKENGGNIVGTYCTYTPKELIYAAGAHPISLCAISEETIPAGEQHLPKNLCPLIKSSYGHALKDSCPYMHFADLVVGETTCDGKKKMYELLGEIKDTYIMELPSSQENIYSKLMWKQEMLKFRDKLEEKFNKKISNEELKKAIKECNEERRILKEFYGLGKLVPPPITGYEMQTILNAVVYSFDKEEQNRKIIELTEIFKNVHKSNNHRVSIDAPRILITGCPIGGVADKIIKQLEEVGAVVVTYENCGG
ncbi:MAG: 2-hydroxyacyl-CoA dehydratase, partial [Fusobacteriaceae bacterium]